jgi:hypothetical protein
MIPLPEFMTQMRNIYARDLYSICKIQRLQNAQIQIKKLSMDRDTLVDEFVRITSGLFKDNQPIYSLFQILKFSKSFNNLTEFLACHLKMTAQDLY